LNNIEDSARKDSGKGQTAYGRRGQRRRKKNVKYSLLLCVSFVASVESNVSRKD
jgi:hypothetical protein